MRPSDSPITKALEAEGAPPGAALREQMAGVDQLAMFEQDELVATGLQFPGIEPAGIKGRKPGQRNRVTRETVDLILQTRRDPLLAMADVASMTPAQVRDAFSLDPEPAAKHWLACVKELASYLHTRQPVAIQTDGPQQATMVQIIMGHGSGVAAPAIVGGQRQDPLGPTISVSYVEGQEQVTREGEDETPESAGVSDA